MRIKPFEEGKHSELVTDELYLEPGDEFEELKVAANEATEDVEEIHQVSPEAEIIIALTDESKFDEDVNPAYFFMGLSLREDMRGADQNLIFVRGVTSISNWKQRLKDMLVHEIGHQVFYLGCDEPGQDQFYSMRFEGHAENFASILSEKKNYGYRPPWRIEENLNLDFGPRKIIDDLEVSRQWPDDTENLSKQMFVSGGDRYNKAEGYTIAYQLVKKLIEEGAIELSELPEMSAERWHDYCKSAINDHYG